MSQSRCPSCGDHQQVYRCFHCDRYWCQGLRCPGTKLVGCRNGRYHEVDRRDCPDCHRRGKTVG